MRSNALYFPFIDIPNSSWMIHTLLYWDKVSSIVPLEYVLKPSAHTKFMRDMVEAELVEQVFPSHHIWKIDGFEETFIRYIESKLPMLQKERPDSRNISRVHVEKMGEISNWLVNHNLAEREGYSWLKMSDSIAGPFMAYLSCVLGNISDVNAVPVTNNEYLANYFKVYKGKNYRGIPNEETKTRDYILNQLLPIPDDNVTIDDLLLFKNKYGKMLPNLRQLIETYVTEVSSITDEEQRQARKRTVALELSEKVDEVNDAMSNTWKKITFGVLTPLIGAGGTVYTTDVTENALAASAAGFSFLGACYSAISMIQADNRAKSGPLGYLAYANKTFG